MLLSVDINISFIDVVYAFSLMSIVLLLPISIAGFGSREASLIFLLSLYGISPEVAISFSILQFFVFYVGGSIVGGIFLLLSPLPLKTIIKDYNKLKLSLKG